MPRTLDSLGLISLLEDLRAAYELAKEVQHAGLQSRLMSARRTLVSLLQQNLDLHGEILDLQEQLAHSRTETGHLQQGAADEHEWVFAQERQLHDARKT